MSGMANRTGTEPTFDSHHRLTGSQPAAPDRQLSAARAALLNGDDMDGEAPITTVEFAAAARNLARTARHIGMEAPSYRSPPRDITLTRTIRHFEGQRSIVAVRIRARSRNEVLADMIDGLIAANGYRGNNADRQRSRLIAAIVS